MKNIDREKFYKTFLRPFLVSLVILGTVLKRSIIAFCYPMRSLTLCECTIRVGRFIFMLSIFFLDECRSNFIGYSFEVHHVH